MSYFVIIFMSCTFDKQLWCDINHASQIYDTKLECEEVNQSYLIKGRCVKIELNSRSK
jgi:hypothetical protein